MKIIDPFVVVLTMAVVIFVLPDTAFAAVLPWEGPLCTIVNSLRTTVATAFAVIAIVFAGIAVSQGESDVFKFLMSVIMGVAIAVLSVRFLSLFGVSFGCPETSF